MTGYRDRDNFDVLQDARAEHASMTGEPLSLAEAMRRLVQNQPLPHPASEDDR